MATAAGHALAHRHQRTRGRLNARRTLHQVVMRVADIIVVDLVHQQIGRGQRVRGDGRGGGQAASLQLREDLCEEAGLRVDAQHTATQSVHDQKAAARDEGWVRRVLRLLIPLLTDPRTCPWSPRPGTASAGS